MPTDLHTLGLDDLRESLEQFLEGRVGVEQMRSMIVACVADDKDAAQSVHALLKSALDEERLSRRIYRILVSHLAATISENEPAPATEGADSEVTQTLQSGAVLRDRFALGPRIDVDQSGEIYEAIDLRKQEAGAEDTQVAIKVARRVFARHPEALKALQGEVAKIRNLSHPNLQRTLDFDRDGDHVFVTMEWLEGESLSRTLDNYRYRRLSAQQAAKIIKGACEGLRHAHEQGLIHSDLKPGSLFVTRDGEAKLFDFGIARASRSVPNALEVGLVDASSLAYSSCEILEGAEPTIQDDVYSMACIAYRILAGQRVYGRLTALEAEREGREPEPVGRLRPNQWQALQNALQFRREHRTRDVSAFLEGLFNTAATPVEPSAAADRESSVGRQAPGKFPTGVLLGIGGGAVAAAIASLLLWPDSEVRDIRSVDISGPVPAPTATAPQTSYARSTPQPAYVGTPADFGPPEDLLAAAEESVVSEKSAPEPKLEAAPATVVESAVAPAPDPDVPVEVPDARAPIIASTAPVAISSAPPASPPPAAVRESAQKSRAASRPPSDQALAESASRAAAPSSSSSSASEVAGGMLAFVLPGPASTAGGQADAATRSPPAPPEPELVALSSLTFKRFVDPKPPRRAAAQRKSGWVEVRFRVNEGGTTADIQIINAEPSGYFEDAALKAVEQWRFEPIKEGDKAVEKRSSVRLRFDLD